MKPFLGPCGGCGETLEFDDYMLGREAECPFCQGVTLCQGKAASSFPTKIVLISAISLLAVGGVTAAIMTKGGGGGAPTELAKADGDSLPANPFSSGESSSSSSSSSGGGGGGGGGEMGMSMDMGMAPDMSMDMGMSMSMDMAGGGGGDGGFAAIKPFLMERCGDCHGAEKQRGDLRLDSLNAVKGVVTPGQSSRSQLYIRVSLPAGHDDIMPPRGAPLTAAQQKAIKDWIDGGAK